MGLKRIHLFGCVFLFSIEFFYIFTVSHTKILKYLLEVGS